MARVTQISAGAWQISLPFLGEHEKEWIKELLEAGQVARFSESALNQSNGYIAMAL